MIRALLPMPIINQNLKQQLDPYPQLQYYYEPGTNRQFRSLKAVRRHLQVTGQQHEQLPRPGQENDEQATRQKDEHTPVVTQQGDQPEVSMGYCNLALPPLLLYNVFIYKFRLHRALVVIRGTKLGERGRRLPVSSSTLQTLRRK